MNEGRRVFGSLQRQASADAVFLRNLSLKGGSKKEREEFSPFSYIRSRSVCNHQEYAAYRQKYLIMYSPFRTREEDSVKDKTKKWFKNFKSKDKPSSRPCAFVEIVFRLFRHTRKSSVVAPVSSTPAP